MPKWIHDRADHIRAKNPGMPKSESFAIATQQAHATGKSPKGYGTPQGRHEANKKYDEPASSYEQKADPSGKSKSASIDVDSLVGFVDELTKIAAPTSSGDVMRLAKPTLGKMPKMSTYSTPRISPPTNPTSDPLSSTKNINAR